MKFKLYGMYFTEQTAWSVSGDDLELYIEINLHASFKRGVFFAVSVANKSFCHINPFKALLMALESETVGMGKYDKLKERVRDLGLWQKL